MKDVSHTFVNIVAHFGSGQIQYVLLPALGRTPSRNLNCPVRMRAVQIRIRRNHLRLKPDSKFQSDFTNLFYQIRKPRSKLFFIHRPVSKRVVIPVSPSKPAVIHNQHFNAVLFGAPGNIQKLFRIKIKISSFPVIDKNRTFLIFIYTAYQMSPVKIMQISRHFSKSLGRIGKHCLRCLENLSRLQIPAETVPVDSHNHPHLIKLVQFRLRDKISRINEIHRIHFSGFLRSIRHHQCYKRMFLMAGFSSYRRDELFSIPDTPPLNMPLPGPASCQRKHLVLPVVHIQTGAVHLLQTETLISCVFNPDASGNNITGRKHRIGQSHPQLQNFILAQNFQSLHLFLCSEGGRQSGKPLLPLLNTAGLKQKLAPDAS